VSGHASRTGSVRTTRPVKQRSASGRRGDRWRASDRWRIRWPRFILGGHMDGVGRPNIVQRIQSVRPAHPVDAKFHSVKGQRLYFMWGLINSPLAGLG
jgi:hypothetical protein